SSRLWYGTVAGWRGLHTRHCWIDGITSLQSIAGTARIEFAERDSSDEQPVQRRKHSQRQCSNLDRHSRCGRFGSIERSQRVHHGEEHGIRLVVYWRPWWSARKGFRRIPNRRIRQLGRRARTAATTATTTSIKHKGRTWEQRT